jgi:NAD(P)-dependent dehydrogenase (short-subunit alcohol dehydrogenase family)
MQQRLRWCNISWSSAFTLLPATNPATQPNYGTMANPKAKVALITGAAHGIGRAIMSEPGNEAHAANKGGLVALAQALAMSLGPDVRVNSVSPGWTHPAPGRPRRKAAGYRRDSRLPSRR